MEFDQKNIPLKTDYQCFLPPIINNPDLTQKTDRAGNMNREGHMEFNLRDIYQIGVPE